MPLAGGPSEKFGNRYERWWTISQMLRILEGGAESIRIEDPGITKAEFVLTCCSERELHQAKRSHPDGKWSLVQLGKPDVQILQAIFNALSGNNTRFVFVSGSDAPELKELAHRAANSENVEEFQSKFLEPKSQKEAWHTLGKYWKHATPAAAYEILRRVEVRTIDERGIQEQVESKACALFLADSEAICTELRRIADDSIHQTVTRERLTALFADRGFIPRRLTGRDSAPAIVQEVTTRYLATVTRKLIRNSLIPRAATQTLLNRLAETKGGCEFALTGKAGVGKTGCIIELVKALQARPVPVVVLAFRLDRLSRVSTTAALGEQLGMEESPALVLEAAASGGEAVLIVDQLDAVSTTSGRSSDLLDIVEALVKETRGLHDRLRLHIVLVCRAFDWENDRRLRRLLGKDHQHVAVTEFSIEDVKSVLSAEGYHPELLQRRQLQLLQLPQNLSLFLEAGFVPRAMPTFSTAKELFDRYWDEKRQDVAKRAVPLDDHWAAVIRVLCREMTQSQQLSIAREKLDEFPPGFIAQMASEGVLTFDGRVYGFGHESFFDYCFARDFVARDQSLIESIIGTEQHLFRRAQVRQVFAYLRDADRARYQRQLAAFLTDDRVRVHLKDLAVALVMNQSDPWEEEWAVLSPFLMSHIASLASETSPEQKLESLIWRHFFASASWFRHADQHGLLVDWLASDRAELINTAVHYLLFYQRHDGDRVAELLEPYVGKGGDWSLRLRRVVEWADHDNSRRFFELFLRLIENGTLDDARAPIATNGTFWSMFHGMAKARPEWIAEVLARWLRRRLSLVLERKSRGAEPAWGELFNHDDFGAQYFHQSADKAPQAFVDNVMPVVLEITESATYGGGDPPRRDSVWPFLYKTQYPTASSACLNALGGALEALAANDPKRIASILTELKSRDTYVANYLLLRSYAANASQFAETAAVLLSEQPWRFHCGFSDNSYWVSIHLIRSIAPHCSVEARAKLETTILGFSSSFERSKTGYKRSGEACFELLSAIESKYRTRGAQTRFEQLERKFKAPTMPPQGIRAYTVGSPIEHDSADKMSDEQWLKAIAKYSSEERLSRWEHPEKGGAWELSGMLRDFVAKQPERFGALSLTFPAGTHPAFIERTLEGLAKSGTNAELKLAVCRKAYSESRLQCGKAIADLLGSLEEPLPDDAVKMLDWLACDHPDPEKELWDEDATDGKPYHGGDILTHGINTVRGRAAEAIRDLIARDFNYVDRFAATLQRLVHDRSISVRACTASTLLALASYDAATALRLFHELVDADDRLLATAYADHFLHHGLQDHFAAIRPYLERMLRSTDTKVGDSAARLSGVAALMHDSANDLVERAMADGPAQRLGVARVAAHNVPFAPTRTWCENHLLVLFNDGASEVRREAGSCFRHLKAQPLKSYEALIGGFCDSAAFREDSFSILHALEESREPIPGVTCTVCEKFLDRLAIEAKDVRSGTSADVHTVAKLIFRTYHQHQSDRWGRRCLNLIDRMCLEGFYGVDEGFEDFER